MSFLDNKLVYVIITLLLILLVVFYLTRQQSKSKNKNEAIKTIEPFFALTFDINETLESHIQMDVLACFASSMTNPFGEVLNEFVVNNTTSDSLVKNTEYINAIKTQNKLNDVINFINLTASTYFIFFTVCLRLAIVDGFCSGNKTPLLRFCNSFIKVIKNLANYYNKVYVINDASTQMANITDNNLINQFKCIRKQFLPVDSEEIYYYPDFIKSFDQSSSNTPTPQPNRQKINPISYIDFSENSDLVLFVSNILEFIMKIAKNETFNYCNGVDLDGTELLPLLYKMFKSDTSSETVDKRCSMTLVKIELPFGQNTGLTSVPTSGSSTGGSSTGGSSTGGSSTGGSSTGSSSGSTTGSSTGSTGGSSSGSSTGSTGGSTSGGSLLNPYEAEYDTSGSYGGLSGSDVNSWNGMYDNSLFPNNAPRTQVSGGSTGSLFGYINPLTGLPEANPSQQFGFGFNFNSQTSTSTSTTTTTPPRVNHTPRPTHHQQVTSYLEPINISLINAKGPNNFFMPSIIIEDDA